MDYPKLLDHFFSKFSQLFQLSFGFALGLAFAQANISVGWLIAWIIGYEFLFYCFTNGTKYYDLLFRLSYNALFIIAVCWGQFIYYDRTTFQDWLYPETNYNQLRKNLLNKGPLMQKLDSLFNTPLEEEEKKEKRKNLKKKFRRMYK